MSEYYFLILLGYVAGAHALAWGLDKLWWLYVDVVLAAAKSTHGGTVAKQDDGLPAVAAPSRRRRRRTIFIGTGLRGA